MIGFIDSSLGYRMTIGVATQLVPGSSLRRTRNRAVDGGEACTFPGIHRLGVLDFKGLQRFTPDASEHAG